MSELVVRPALPADAEQVADLLGELGYPSDVATTRGLLQRTVTAPAADVLVATEGKDPGRVLGFVAVQVGTMFTELSDDARLTAFVELTSGVRPGREGAHAFYPALGYEDTGHVRYRREL